MKFNSIHSQFKLQNLYRFEKHSSAFFHQMLIPVKKLALMNSATSTKFFLCS
jgi:hypothetical protein